MTTLSDKARKIAEHAHAGQRDKAGRPYFTHPAFVASLLNTDEEKTVAYLHDVLEDTATGREYLAAIFPLSVMAALDALTHKEDESYEDYIDNIKKDPLAVKVKLADLTHNMDISRIPAPTAKDWQRIEKYKAAYKRLIE